MHAHQAREQGTAGRLYPEDPRRHRQSRLHLRRANQTTARVQAAVPVGAVHHHAV